MQAQHDALLMRIYFTELSCYHGRSLYGALCEALLRAGVEGATVFRGAEGFGARRCLSTDRSVDSPGDLPMVIEIIDVEERLRAILPQLNAMIEGGLVTVERVRATRLRPAAIEH
jgi:hypothetical protein